MQQHTVETGQCFTPAVREAVWTQSQGQPWLVNALCAGACIDNKAGRDRSRAIDKDEVFAAREKLILSRRTHLDLVALGVVWRLRLTLRHRPEATRGRAPRSLIAHRAAAFDHHKWQTMLG